VSQFISNNGIPWGSIFPLMITIAGALVWTGAPLDSSRPPSPSVQTQSLDDAQTVDALLWQDPLSAVEASINARNSLPEQPQLLDASSFKRAFFTRLKAARNDPTRRGKSEVLILAVSIPGGPYSENSERRSRGRSALVQALGSSMYYPRVRDHIGALKMALSESPQCSVKGQIPEVYIPFEWYSLRKDLGSRQDVIAKEVLVLWIREDALADKPLERLNHILLKTVRRDILAGEKESPGRDSDVALAIIGPATSSGLVHLTGEALQELNDGQLIDRLKALPSALEESGPPREPKRLPPSLNNGSHPFRFQFLQGCRIFAGSSTAPTDAIASMAGLDEAKKNKITEALRNKGIETTDLSEGDLALAVIGIAVNQKVDDPSNPTLVRTIPTDDHVARETLFELERRGVLINTNRSGRPPFRKGPDDIAIISEWDTEYGRTLPMVFAQQAGRIASEHTAGSRREAPDIRLRKRPYVDEVGQNWIHTYSYLQGLDGRTVSRNKNPESEKARSADANKFQFGYSDETSGDNHSDYLRRLAVSIRQKDKQLRATKGSGFKAIGVLGSDLYDKLMVIKALRTELPDHLFFTNNIDAQMVQTRDLPSMRNVVIVSPYGLELSLPWSGLNSHNGVVAPFRDSYQTAAYATARVALSTLDEGYFIDTRPGVVRPRIFEIGRTGFYNLSLPETPAKQKSNPATFLPPLHEESATLAERPAFTLVTRMVEGVPGSVIQFLGSIFVVLLGVFALGMLRWLRTTRSAVPRQPTVNFDVVEILTEKSLLVCLAVLVVVLSTGFFLSYFLSYGDEPFAIAGGVSVWPSIMIRWVAIFMALHFVAKILRTTNASYRKATSRFFNQEQVNDVEKELQDQTDSFIEHLKAEAAAVLSPWRWKRPTNAATSSHNSILRRTLLPAPENRANHHVDPFDTWIRHIEAGDPGQRIARGMVVSLLFTLGVLAVLWNVDYPLPRIRGNFSDVIEYFTMLASIGCLVFISLVAGDVLRHNCHLISSLNKGVTLWDLKHVDATGFRQLPPNVGREWADLLFLVARTECVARYIFYPFWLVLLLTASRLPCFDHWTWRPSFFVFLCACFSYSAYYGWRLRHEAELARADSLEFLSRILDKAKNQDVVRKVMDSIANEKRGAFAPISSQPFVQAILWLMGTVSVGSLIAYFSHLVG
jgi:hypothetical protein